MTERVAAAWEVREHVFASDARCIGTIAQRRRLVGDDTLRVIQDNVPAPALADHPVAAFAGHHEFALVRDGARRRYLGPAVIGTGLELDDGVIVSAGVWPSLGWSFTGWSISAAPTRLLTGGSFRRGTASIATIVGVAAADGTIATANASALDLSEPVHPGDLASRWSGPHRRVDLAGNTIATGVTVRRYHGAGWSDRAESIELTGNAAALAARGTCDGVELVGAGRRLGPTVELELWCGPTLAITVLDVLDIATASLTCLRWRHHDGRLDSIDVIRLCPEGAPR